MVQEIDHRRPWTARGNLRRASPRLKEVVCGLGRFQDAGDTVSRLRVAEGIGGETGALRVRRALGAHTVAAGGRHRSTQTGVRARALEARAQSVEPFGGIEQLFRLDILTERIARRARVARQAANQFQPRRHFDDSKRIVDFLLHKGQEKSILVEIILDKERIHGGARNARLGQTLDLASDARRGNQDHHRE